MAAMSPSIWWKWLQNRMLVVVRPTRMAAVASSGPRLAYSISLTAPACAQHDLYFEHRRGSLPLLRSKPCSAFLTLALVVGNGTAVRSAVQVLH